MTIDIDAASMRSLERSESRAYRVERGGFMNALFDLTTDHVLDGQAVKFDVPFPYKGEWIMLKAGCFGDIAESRVGFWIDHDEALEIGSTDDSLSVVIDDESARVRLDLSKCRMGPVIARMLASDNRASMSVGSDILAEHRETIGGERVRVVTRAKLKEITLCARGAAGDNAFCYLVDKTFTPAPVAGSRSPTFRAAQVLHKVSRQVKALKASMAETYDRGPLSAKRTYTLDELNRLATLDTERLQSHARELQD
jgi:hypothetical protein